MAPYDAIQPAAFIPDPAAGPMYRQFSTLFFPREWREAVLDLYARSMPEQRRERILSRRRVPIRRLDSLMRAVAPELVAVGADASIDEETPWIYAEHPYPSAVLSGFVNAWLHDMHRDKGAENLDNAETYRRIQEAKRLLDSSRPQWGLTGVDLLSATVSDGGTAEPDKRLYRLLPEYLADRIARHSMVAPYEHGGERREFKRVAGSADSEAELISWPPCKYRKTMNGPTSYYSASIRVALRTVPFSPVPRIHLTTGIHRWVSGKARMQGTRAASAYLLADSSLVPDGPTPERFSVAFLGWRPDTRQVQWRDGGPGGMLVRVSAMENLPAADVLVKDAEPWLTGRDGLQIAVTHHTTMGRHDVGSGLMPEERRRLVTWAAEALKPEFTLAPPLKKAGFTNRKGTPDEILAERRPVKNAATDAEKSATAAANAVIDARNGDARRAGMAAKVGSDGLSLVLLYQSRAMRDHLIRAAEAHLNLGPYRSERGPEKWSWAAPEFAVRLTAVQEGALVAPLGAGTGPSKGKEFEEAIRRRRVQLAEALADIGGERAPVLAFVELDGQYRPSTGMGFRPRADPKGAIRLGCRDAGMVSQFFRPLDQAVKEEERDADAAYRAESAWADGLRQLGTGLTPRHSLGDDIPRNLAQVAFWMVKRQVNMRSKHRQFTPVAVYGQGDGPILGRTPEMDEWVPYPELLKQLTGRISKETTEREQQAVAAAFIQKTLYALRGTDTLVITHAQNSRNRWPWLTNPGLVADRLALGDGPVQRLRVHGKRLRIARVAVDQRSESPEWWAQKGHEPAGHAKGLWLPGSLDPSGRVFYATAERPDTVRVHRETTKLTPHWVETPAKGGAERKSRSMLAPDKQAGTPQLVEFTIAGLCEGDDPASWAMFLQQQRKTEDHRSELVLPLMLHLAALTKEYALPYEEGDADAADVSNEGTGPEQMELTFE